MKRDKNTQKYLRQVSSEQQWTSFVTWLAAIGGIYFFVYLIFSLLFYKERLMADGSYKVFEMCNEKWFPYTPNRYIIWLIHFLPVLAVNLCLPLKAVICSWILNYFIFYITCFLVLVFKFRDWFGGCVIICIHAFTMGTSFFNLADETLPPAVLSIVLFSVLRHSPKQIGWIFFLLFFIAFSHLVAVISLVVVGLYFSLDDPPKAKGFFQKNNYWILLFLIMFIVRLSLAISDPYENGRMSITSDRVYDLIHHLSIDYFLAVIHFMLSTELVVSFFTLCLFLIMIKNKRWRSIVF